jgi:hypothetical protein
MSAINDGGPAFPSTIQYFPDDKNANEEQGMTLRDWFAGQALMGMMASGNPKTSLYLTKQDATYLYEIADAMLKAREPKP